MKIPTNISSATKAGLTKAGTFSAKVARKHGGKLAVAGAGVSFGAYLIGGRRGRGVDRTSGRPTGMYSY